MATVKFPDEELISFDDTEVKKVLVELGVIHNFSLPPDPRSTVFTYGVDDHPTHWLLFACFRGFKQKSDNGYMMFGWRKKKFTRKQAEGYAQEFVRKHGVSVEKRLLFPQDGKPPQS
ncbi:hypothetical protein [Opitutus terrae]|uniref:Uncharacterized protein n=1 Tax=Opitutus terrae (strain DSM 11246 / JCM 15787 / PB90-1) TaxID=452637 RepID=B1ZTZ1_OPITP|nr:hypothetical protein [Opitutus terrae]ACB75873.1 hypothetical protein Oter_2591 [Opitutus terrae PB90-1]